MVRRFSGFGVRVACDIGLWFWGGLGAICDVFDLVVMVADLLGFWVLLLLGGVDRFVWLGDFGVVWGIAYGF